MPSKNTPTPAAAPHYVNFDQMAEALNISKRQAAKLRHESWFPPAYEWGPRTLRWDLNEVVAAMQRHARRTRVGAEPAHLVEARREGRAA